MTKQIKRMIFHASEASDWAIIEIFIFKHERAVSMTKQTKRTIFHASEASNWALIEIFIF